MVRSSVSLFALMSTQPTDTQATLLRSSHLPGRMGHGSPAVTRLHWEGIEPSHRAQDRGGSIRPRSRVVRHRSFGGSGDSRDSNPIGRWKGQAGPLESSGNCAVSGSSAPSRIAVTVSSTGCRDSVLPGFVTLAVCRPGSQRSRGMIVTCFLGQPALRRHAQHPHSQQILQELARASLQGLGIARATTFCSLSAELENPSVVPGGPVKGFGMLSSV